MTRLKTQGLIETRADAERLSGEVVDHQIEANRLTVEMDAKISDIKKQYEGSIDSEKKMIESKTLILNMWAEQNPDEFNGKKSIDFVHAIIGFRTGQPKVEKRKNITWAKIVEALQKLKWGKIYLREREPELDKEKLIADRKTLTVDQLNSVGLKITQDESFFIEPKTENLI